MALIVSPRSGAIERMVRFSSREALGIGTVFVTTSSRIGLLAMRSIAGGENTGWVAVAFQEEIVAQEIEGGNLVDRDVKKALDLAGVQVDREHAVGAGGPDQVGDQLGGDRHPGLVLLVRPPVPVIGDHGGDATGRR